MLCCPASLAARVHFPGLGTGRMTLSLLVGPGEEIGNRRESDIKLCLSQGTRYHQPMMLKLPTAQRSSGGS